MVRLDVKITRLAHGLRRRVGVGEDETGEPPGERRFPDPLPAADEPGVRQTAFAIGRQHFRFGALMADERIDMAGMRRSGQRVRFGKIVGVALLGARLAHARNCDGKASRCRRLKDLMLRSRAKARRLEDAPASAAVAAHGSVLRGRFAAPQDEVVGRFYANLALSAPAGSSLLSTADQMAAATLSSLLAASMTTQRRGSAAAMSRNARRKVW